MYQDSKTPMANINKEENNSASAISLKLVFDAIENNKRPKMRKNDKINKSDGFRVIEHKKIKRRIIEAVAIPKNAILVGFARDHPNKKGGIPVKIAGSNVLYLKLKTSACLSLF